ncbi:TauD/TfdA family dioxygenase [Actinoplanes sp. NPDC049802]|uniref:TauD/TfdA family dioxygenase n=1 Tax=Actinoplanes sp. NPDC049802 TaxID=3154742 RepID=UPI0033D667DC
MAITSEMVHEYTVDDDERTVLAELAESAAVQLYAKPEAVVDQILEMPAELRHRLLAFADDSPSGFFLIRGLETGSLPETPTTHGGTVLTTHVTTGFMVLVAELLGSLTGYADEKGGDLVHEVHPVRGEEQRIENTGSVAFDFHTENVHHPLRPDFLALLCLRQDHDKVAATRVASIREAVSYLSPEHLQALREPAFDSLYPTSFTRGSSGQRPVSPSHPVLFGNEEKPFMRFNSHNTKARDAVGRAALQALTEALEHVSRDVVLNPGEMVIVDNHIAAHGRSAFVARYDGKDRWLRRCYSLRSTPRWTEAMMDRPRVLPSLSGIRGVL